MEYLMACRICLATDVKLFDMCKYHLKTAFENLTGLEMSQRNCIQHLCGYCGMMVKKYSLFRSKCERSQVLLETLLEEHKQVTTYNIKFLDRVSHNLTLPYTHHVIQNFDSTIAVKEELIVKTNNNSDYDDFSNDEKLKKENLENTFEENVLSDSDEEPLSKKVKKRKRKKSKKELKPFSTQYRCDKILIKTENCYYGTFLTDNPSNEVEGNNQKLSSNYDLKHSTTDQNFITDDQKLITYDKKFQTNTNTKQVLDMETNHKMVILSQKEQIEEVIGRKTSANYMNSIYKCECCYKGFMTEATYKNHMMRHDSCCGPVTCPVCSTHWPDERALRAHTVISHERRYICKVCGHTSKSSHKAKEHTQWHAGVTYPCHKCDRSFTKSTSYLTHVRLRHASHTCSQCGLSFIGKNGLNMHEKKAHRDGTVVPRPLHACERCHVGFRTTEALLRHRDVTSNLCDDTLHVCTQCGDHLETEPLLEGHKDIHKKNDAVRTCAQCLRTFSNERSLATHMSRAHAARAHTKTHCVCEVCGYKCGSASSLVNHQRIHSGEKPHACTLCNKRFSVAQRLQIHVRTHTGERPFQCARCPKAFKHKAALNRHDRVHTGVKPYPCSHCGKRFSQSNSMKQHISTIHINMHMHTRKHAL